MSNDTLVEDIIPLPSCAGDFDAVGAHRLALIIPGNDEGQITAICRRCGIVRRFPASGSLDARKVDDLTVEEIEARFFGRKK